MYLLPKRNNNILSNNVRKFKRIVVNFAKQHQRSKEKLRAVAAGPAGPAAAGPMLPRIYNKKAQLTQREAQVTKSASI